MAWVASHRPVAQALVMLEKRPCGEAAACTRKYLIASSVTCGWWDLENRGTIARVLISSLFRL